LTYLDYLPPKQKKRNNSRTRERKPLVSFVPSNYIIDNSNGPQIISNGEELTKMEYIILLTHGISDISRMLCQVALISSGNETDCIVDNNQP
jgi:hypothetical protein